MRTVLWCALMAGSFDGVPSHTPRQSVLDAAAQAREADADLIVTFGGGSGTDAGKLIRLALKHDIRAVEEFDRLRCAGRAGFARVRRWITPRRMCRKSPSRRHCQAAILTHLPAPPIRGRC